MAASIAHEINNPLAAVTNTLYLAQRYLNQPDLARTYLEKADDELKRISHITRQTLGFYRESTAPSSVSLNSVLDSAVELLRGKVKGAHIERQYEGEFRITAVEGELRQVFSNLIDNSLEAVGEEGIVKIRISKAYSLGEGQQRIRVTIADNGEGINEATLPRIFEPLFTTKGSTGSGLGLWVSKRLVQKHGGSIRVRSGASGNRKGSTFSIILPVNAANAHADSAGATDFTTADDVRSSASAARRGLE